MIRKYISIMISIMIIFFSIIFFSNSNIKAAQPMLTISINTPVQEATPSEEISCNVTFGGEVYTSCYGCHYDLLNVSLFVDAGDWEAEVFPKFIFMDQPGIKPFHFVVKVPKGTPGNTCRKIMVFGNCTETIYFNNETYTTQTEISPSAASIIVPADYSFNVTCIESKKKVERGKSVTYNLSIVNNGNFKNSINFNVTNLEEIQLIGMKIIIPESISIQRNETMGITIIVEVFDGAKAGTHEIQLQVQNGPIIENVTLKIYVKEDNSIVIYRSILAIFIIIGIVGVIIILKLRRK